MIDMKAKPTCGHAIVVKPSMFHYRGRSFSGLVCETCNSLWDNPEDSFWGYVEACARAEAERAKEPS